MLRQVEAIQAILNQPLDYLHPDRNVVPTLFETPKVRALLNQLLLREWGLESLEPSQIEWNSWTDLWVRHWKLLPDVARFMGVQLMRPKLAYGARLYELDASARAFACLDFGCYTSVAINESESLEHTVVALGFAALNAWRSHIPEVLMQRLPLQFAPQIVVLQQVLPQQIPNSSLFILAVQHARIHQNSR
ncbi:hypothetical protein PflCFBP13517_25690 [Pseudomonas fluorescens]|nr:hypothetical protein PflCFBP13517_25690 [Pseudomonas fluorescens]